MLNLFKKKSIMLIKHQYKNLLIDLPANWEYELEQDEQEACFDPSCQSTLRLNIIKVIPSDGASNEQNIEALTGNQQFMTTQNGYLLTKANYRDSIDSGENITLVSWRLISNAGYEKIMAVVTYTVLKKEKNSKKEKMIIHLIENSLKNSELS
ncbi:hypothetical protein HQ865_09865 [Mucilaginibacter mali]|uniref:DUF1795 domain-containing protein n=1 Tax=Mucilaginibacter mali TaxID=2740462 RepID=A0A7D4QJZ8_9SPHI|nr:hypothetical protein [Mucilaginibacter mali]QKJ30050.1 hypothetical protein HQ865_09865 [Mucilaginibacter mali]